MKPSKLAPWCGLILLALVSCGCNKLKARDQLNKGVQAYRNALFQSAIEHFKQAISLDPTLLNAKIYLATAYSQQYVQGGETDENIKIAKDTIAAFEDVLKVDPANPTALGSIAQMYYNLKDWDKAKEYQRRRLTHEPNDPEPYYWIGVIDWAQCYPRRMELRKKLNIMAPKDPAKPDIFPPLPAKAREELEQQNGALVTEGVDALKKDIDIRPNDDGAMVYLNLMLREKADLETDESARADDTKLANDYMNKALDIRKGGTTGKAGSPSS